MSEAYDPTALAERWGLVLPVDLAVGAQSRLAPRRASLEGAAIGLLNNSKGNADHLLERIATRLGERHGVRDFVRVTKPIFSRVAPDDQLEQLKRCDAVITAIAD
jgi:hypothetical protein